MEQRDPSQVSQVSQDNSMDQQADRVSRVCQNSSTDPRADWVSWVSQVGNTEQKTGSSGRIANTESRVMETLANTESQVTENLANTKSRITQNLANMESWVMEKSANTESRVTKNLANMENRVMQDSEGRKPEEEKGVAPSKRPAPRWCPRGITKEQKCGLQKKHQRELAKKKEEEEQDYWFNHLQPMTRPKQKWRQKWLAKEENGSSGSSEEEVEVTSAKGDSNPGSGSGNSESGNCNLGRKEDRREEEPTQMDINMFSMISAKFRAPMEEVTELALGAEHAMFEKPENPGAHMKPLLIRGHLDGTSVEHMLIDGGTSINILLLSLFKMLGHIEVDLKRTNLSLSGFAGDPTEAKGIICKELTVGSKILPMAFFVVDVKGHYNVLLKQRWVCSDKCKAGNRCDPASS
jgi:hypothetical protein